MSTLLPFRRARLEEADTIRDLVRQAYAKWIPVIGREPKPMNADYEQAVLAHMVWVMPHLQEIVAVLEIIPHHDHLLIENIAVATSQQGLGMGKQLMAFAENIARALGLSEIRLYTNASFTENISLYSSLGYRETHRQDFPQFGGTHNMAVFIPKALEATH